MFMWNVSQHDTARRVIHAIDDVDGLRREIDDNWFRTGSIGSMQRTTPWSPATRASSVC